MLSIGSAFKIFLLGCSVLEENMPQFLVILFH